ncbi:MAG: long-chain fatty acid--CoA ligase [Actinomycetota bacterium]|nr:long-chain fatty acid--CoA ligase [Actinomycetota bacterium]
MPSGLPATMVEAFQNISKIEPGAVAIRTVRDAVAITWREYADRVEAYAGGLSGLGLRRGDTLAIMLTNRPEFHLVDTAAIHLGATSFSVYNTSSPEQIAFLLGNAEARVVVTETVFVEVLRASGAEFDHMIVVDDAPEGTIPLAQLPDRAPADFDFEASWRAVIPDDVCTLIYTSGTTGNPKGVELTHANLVAECATYSQVVEGGFGDRVMSYLPSAHIADRLSSHYLQMTHGMQTTDVNDLRALAEALQYVRPNTFLAVPRVWDKLRFKIESAIKDAESPIKRRLGTGALAIARKRAAALEAGTSLRAHEELLWRVADKVVLSKVRATLGFGDLRFGLSGAAAISPDTLRFFAALGVEICEVWGMSETTAGTTINPPGEARIGTVGKPVPAVEVKLGDDGELFVRGAVVMRGYRKEPAKTAEVLDADGWLATGDIATIDDDGYVSIVDRKKELIISASGKNMSPSNIENTLKSQIPVAFSVVVVGDGRPYNVALVVLDPEAAAEVAAKAGRPTTDAAELAKDEAVLKIVEAGIAAGNARLSRVEQVKEYKVLPVFWLPGGDELTPTLKLRRKPIDAKYDVEIEKLYGGQR